MSLQLKLVRARFNDFKVLKKCELTFDENLTVIIGPSNSGKTTILEALKQSITRDLIYPRASLYANKKSRRGSSSIELYLRMEKSELLEILRSQKIRFDNKYYLITDQTIVINWEISLVNTEPNLTLRFEDESFSKQFQNDNDDIINRILHAFLAILPGKFIYIPSDRKMPKFERLMPFQEFDRYPDRDQYIRHYLLHLKRNNPVTFKKLEKELNLAYGKMTIDPRLNYDTGNIDITIKQGDLAFDINEMGGGIRYFLLILSRILYSDASIILIDEPDLNMHASLVRDFALYLQRVTEKQVIVTSHNETFINVVDFPKIRRVRPINPIFTSISLLQEKDLDELTGDLGINVSNFNKSLLLSSKVVIIVEGDNDEEYIRTLIARAGLTNQIKSLNVTFLKTGNSETIDARVIDVINNRAFPFVLVRDRDEHNQEHIENIQKKLKDRVHYWNRREIENFALDYSCLLREIKKGAKANSPIIQNELKILNLARIQRAIKGIAEQYKARIVISRVLTNQFEKVALFNLSKREAFINQNASKSRNNIVDLIMREMKAAVTVTKANISQEIRNEEKKLEKQWNAKTIIRICPGKELVGSIAQWGQRFGINFTTRDLINKLSKEEVDSDIKRFVQKLLLVSERKVIDPQVKDRSSAIGSSKLLSKKYFSYSNFSSSMAVDLPNNLLFVLAHVDPKASVGTEDENIITVMNANNHQYIDIIRVGNWKNVTLNQIVYDPITKFLYASGDYLESKYGEEYSHDYIYKIDPTKRKLVKAKKLKSNYEDKEGGLSEIIVNSTGIYVSSVDAEGPNRTLYILDTKTLAIKRKISVGKYGAFGIATDNLSRVVYVLGSGTFRGHDYEGFLLVLNETSFRIEHVIELPLSQGLISPGNKQQIAVSAKLVYIIIRDRLFLLEKQIGRKPIRRGLKIDFLKTFSNYNIYEVNLKKEFTFTPRLLNIKKSDPDDGVYIAVEDERSKKQKYLICKINNTDLRLTTIFETYSDIDCLEVFKNNLVSAMTANYSGDPNALYLVKAS